MARRALTVAVTAFICGIAATLTLLYLFGNGHGADLRSSRVFNSAQEPHNAYDASSSDMRRPKYMIGVGKADITGPSVEIHFMGFAEPSQRGSGIRQRLYSRAFIIGNPDRPEDRFVYLVQDIQSGDSAVRQGILDGLRKLGDDYAVYGQQNLAVTGTHSHSGPGGWLNYLLPQITSLGFSKSSYRAVVEGSIRSIKLAHESLRLGHITVDSIKIPDANINRSPFAYLNNPQSERDAYDETVDKELTMMKFQAANDHKDIGILTWFPVHGTSLLANNTLVTGDNKGVAADMFENYAKRLRSSSPDFVAGFSQANVGDTSPNTRGAFCEFGPQEGQPCDFKTSLCGGKAEPCHARGSHWGLDDGGTASSFENGKRQYVAARKLFEAMKTKASKSGPDVPGVEVVVKALHVFVNFANRIFELENGTSVRTCPAALGYSFAAGTTDWPGNRDFKQHNTGEPDANPLWEYVRNRINKPGPDQKACQGVKPILLNVGEATTPYLWSPNVVDLQFFRVANFIIIVSTGEATTMAGRRWRNLVKSTALSAIPELAAPRDTATEPAATRDLTVVLGGPSNSYTHYITTEEEYHIQRYEGASTMYGPNTLAGYLELTKKLIPYLSVSSVTQKNTSLPPFNPTLPRLDPGPSPPIHTAVSLSFISPVVRDSAGLFKKFGDVVTDVQPTYRLPPSSSSSSSTSSWGREDPKDFMVEAEFVGANPRNNLRLEGSYARVERYDAHTGVWSSFRDDADWSLVFEWERSSTVIGTSRVRIRWELGWEVGIWGRKDSDEGVEVPAGKKTELKSRRWWHAVMFWRWKRSSVELDPMVVVAGKVRGYPDDYMRLADLRGTYRLRYFGDAKSLGGSIESFDGLSSEFRLL